ncbi:hypothetical protein KKC45_00795 [Patescibacteria group bacterium]|nr:hypothetical protein [Patescibacteria group bacterium]
MNIDNDEKLNRIDKLKKGLYSKTIKFSKERSEFRQRKHDVKGDWEKGSLSQDIEMNKKIPKRKTFFEKMLIIAIVFLVVSILAVSATFLGGINRVSTSNIDISVIGPASIESGGELSLQVTITNKNSTDLELADLIIEYPTGTRSPDDVEMELNKFRESLDVIPAGKSVRKEVKAVLYGEENSDKNIIISLEYRIAGSNAIFFKDRKYDISISSSPVNLVVSPLEESISGQEVEFSVSVLSNTENSVEGLLLSADYPFGFEFKSSEPKPSYSDNVWKVEGGDVVKIKGVISGQEGDERVFKFTSGTKSSKDEKNIGAIFALAEKSLFIKKPFMGIELAFNGDTSKEFISGGDKSIRADVMWSNNSPAKIFDAEISIKLKGDILDKTRISVERGFYRSIDNTIVWDKRTNGELSEVSPGESGRFSFYMEPLDISARSSFLNPEVFIDVSAKGNRVSEENIPEEINSSISKTIKFYSDLMITPRSTYYTGSFVNSGSIPPTVDKETTYTIVWTITNTMNDIANTRVVSTLPPYVRWMGVVSPSSEIISYNPVGGEIIWEVGDIKPGTGIQTSAKEISFQVALMPSVSQVGLAPTLTGDVIITGTDRFTSTSLKSTKSGVSTRLGTDPGFINEDAVVVAE